MGGTGGSILVRGRYHIHIPVRVLSILYIRVGGHRVGVNKNICSLTL